MTVPNGDARADASRRNVGLPVTLPILLPYALGRRAFLGELLVELVHAVGATAHALPGDERLPEQVALVLPPFSDVESPFLKVRPVGIASDMPPPRRGNVASPGSSAREAEHLPAGCRFSVHRPPTPRSGPRPALHDTKINLPRYAVQQAVCRKFQ